MGSDDETITVTFITNHEVDPSEVEPVENDSEFRRQLVGAVVTDSAHVQEVLGTSTEALDNYRRRVKEVRGDGQHE